LDLSKWPVVPSSGHPTKQINKLQAGMYVRTDRRPGNRAFS